MHGGWMMSMTWMRAPGQTWPGAAFAFLAMWIAMMAAMMLPVLAPMLSRYRHAVATSDRIRLAGSTALVVPGTSRCGLLPARPCFPQAQWSRRWPWTIR